AVIVAGALSSGLLSFASRPAISIGSVPLAIAVSLVMWGVLYQGFNAIFPSFYPELFPTRTRVTAMAIGQNAGTSLAALLPAVFATVARPGSRHVPLVLGSITFGVTLAATLPASSARANYRIRLEALGNPDAAPVPKPEYDRLRTESVVSAAVAAAREHGV